MIIIPRRNIPTMETPRRLPSTTPRPLELSRPLLPTSRVAMALSTPTTGLNSTNSPWKFSTRLCFSTLWRRRCLDSRKSKSTLLPWVRVTCMDIPPMEVSTPALRLL